MLLIKLILPMARGMLFYVDSLKTKARASLFSLSSADDIANIHIGAIGTY